jgi:hypothetical protein
MNLALVWRRHARPRGLLAAPLVSPTNEDETSFTISMKSI